MGIRGLQGLLRENESKIATKGDISNVTIVIDANNLCNWLLRKVCLDCNSKYYRCDVYGVDFVGYGEIVREFFAALKRCSIKPILVFDGSNMSSEYKQGEIGFKEKVHYKRGVERMQQAQLIQEFDTINGSMAAPKITKFVLRMIVHELGLTIIPTPYEADSYIAKIANDHNCLVLTNDSDFFIYPLSGFILLDTFDFRNLNKVNGKDCIRCTQYTHKFLGYVMPGLKPEMMPFLCMLDDDYKEAGIFEDATTIICQGAYYNLATRNYGHRKMVSLLNWLRDKSVESAKNHILDLSPTSDRERLLKAIDDILESYKIRECDNFVDKLELIYPKSTSETKNTNQSPANYFKGLIEKDRLSSIVIDIIFKNIHYNHSAIEDASLPSPSFVMYRPIAVIITLVRQTCGPERAKNSMRMFDRFEGSYKELKISLLEHLEGFGSLEHLDCYSMVTLDEAQKKKLLMATFRFNEDELDKMRSTLATVFRDDFLQEATICMLLVKYIGQETKMAPESHFVNALLLTLFYYAAQKGQLNKDSFKEQNYDTLLHTLSLHEIKNNGRQYSDEPKIYRRIVHYISQLQSALSAYCILNDLLDRVLPDPKYGLYFNGVLIFRITKLLRNGQETLHTLCEGAPGLIAMCFRLVGYMVHCDNEERLEDCISLLDRLNIA